MPKLSNEELKKAKTEKELILKGAIFDLLEVEDKLRLQFDQITAAKNAKLKELTALRKS